jgi:hypothetical protein
MLDSSRKREGTKKRKRKEPPKKAGHPTPRAKGKKQGRENRNALDSAGRFLTDSLRLCRANLRCTPEMVSDRRIENAVRFHFYKDRWGFG